MGRQGRVCDPDERGDGTGPGVGRLLDRAASSPHAGAILAGCRRTWSAWYFSPRSTRRSPRKPFKLRVLGALRGSNQRFAPRNIALRQAARSLDDKRIDYGKRYCSTRWVRYREGMDPGQDREIHPERLFPPVYRDVEKYRAGKKLVEPSGSRSDRPGLLAMLKDATRGEFDVLLAWREDRLYRGLRSMLTVLETVQEYKIEILLAAALDLTPHNF